MYCIGLINCGMIVKLTAWEGHSLNSLSRLFYLLASPRMHGFCLLKKNIQIIYTFQLANIPANSAHKTVWVVGFPQGWNHFPLNEFITAEAPCAIESLIVQSTDIVSLSHKKSSLSQVTSTSYMERKERFRSLKNKLHMKENQPSYMIRVYMYATEASHFEGFYS